MKGLLYRELYLKKKSFLISGTSMIIFMIFEILISLSFEYGNLARVPETDKYDIRLIIYFYGNVLNGLMLTATFASDHNVLPSDFQSKWQLYSYTLPITEKQYVGVKMGLQIAGGMISMILSMLSYALLKLLILNHMEIAPQDAFLIKATFYTTLLICPISTMIECIQMPLIYRFKNKNIASVIIMIISMLFSFSLTGIFSKMAKDYAATHSGNVDDGFYESLKQQSANFLNHWVWMLLLGVIVMIICSYFACVSILKRRPY